MAPLKTIDAVTLIYFLFVYICCLICLCKKLKCAFYIFKKYTSSQFIIKDIIFIFYM